ncbi:glycoside hydrolase family 3 C-terminal domain-containing protein [Streptomyces sp. NPDC004267]|uniref:glycoside hydrolase family 3 C-terminal domain-containing protein n=1 Tax=Streptomyces sp. NPDC004267 TaxID=3364694 RepID=UPI00367451FF
MPHAPTPEQPEQREQPEPSRHMTERHAPAAASARARAAAPATAPASAFAPRPTSRRRLLLALVGATALTAAPALPGGARATARGRGGSSGAAPGSERVERLLARLTLDEKAALLHGAADPHNLGQAGYVPGVPRLGIPALRLADGPAGVRVHAPATALPAPVMLAAAFDPALARSYGQVLGSEGRALGQDVVLSPMVNLIRTPYAGRNFETFAEDPLLSADLVAAEIGGIQAEGVVATVKHLALNNQERDRMTVDVRAGEQTLHETELRAFEAAVAAGAGAVMAAYNKVDGVHATESRTLLGDILRDRWGFDGWVMSDWGAVHSTAAALTSGCDMEMPGGRYLGAALIRAVRDGRVAQSAVDTAVRRILTVRERFALLGEETPGRGTTGQETPGHGTTGERTPGNGAMGEGVPGRTGGAGRPARDSAAGARTALRVALAGATLLRNEGHALPLTGPAARSLAVIGPTGAVPFVSGGGSAHVVPDAATSPLDALRDRAGDGATVTYALGEDPYGKPFPRTGGYLAPERSRDGLDALDAVNVAAGESWHYEGALTTTADDDWSFFVHYSGRRPTVLLDGAELFPVRPGIAEYFTAGIGGRAADGLELRRADRRLAAGTHVLTVTAVGGTDGQLVRLRAADTTTRATDVAEAVTAARAARSAVLFAYEDATEGRDRASLALPGRQEALIRAVTAANPRTTVVLNTSSAVTMPWLDATAAVLQMYYPGQEGGPATAAVLFGDADPGGRLTQTFPRSADAHPTAGDPGRYPGQGGIERYDEGIHIGHRWYDAQDVTPLFPFGHGLSYTTFGYGEPSAEPVGDALHVSFTVVNTGARTGIEVAQVYLGPSPDLAALGIDQPVRLLAGYRRLQLAPRERRRVTVPVAARTLSSWDAARHRWVLGTGPRQVWVGASSRDLRLTARAEVRPVQGRAAGTGTGV